MASIVKQTQRWVKANLITPEQAAALVEYEKGRFSLFSITNVFLFLGVFALGCGICALVAANWQDIPDAFKLIVMYLLTAGTAVAAERKKNTNPAAFEALLFFFMLLLFTTIGLNGQVFHLASDSWKAFMFWSFLAFFPLFLSQKVWFGYLWWIIFLGSFFVSPYMRDVAEALEPFGASALLFVSFLSYAVFLLLWPVREKKPVFLVPLCTITLIGTLPALVLPYFDYKTPETWTLIFVSVYGAAFAFGVRKMMPFERITKSILTASIGLYILMILLFSQKALYCGFLVFVLQFIQILLIAGFAYSVKERKMFNVLSAVAALTIFFRFLDLFGTLMQTGFGLILTGIVLIAATKGWIAFMKKISVRFEGGKAS